MHELAQQEPEQIVFNHFVLLLLPQQQNKMIKNVIQPPS
jgi:hypothetical protein